MVELSITTSSRDEMIDITDSVSRIVRDSGVESGIATVYCPHTTAGITINENGDPDVKRDIIHQLDEMVPHSQPFYKHFEGNSAAHVKSTITGCSQTILIDRGQLTLGTWQSIYFCEYDGPRKRRVLVTAIGAK